MVLSSHHDLTSQYIISCSNPQYNRKSRPSKPRFRASVHSLDSKHMFVQPVIAVPRATSTKTVHTIHQHTKPLPCLEDRLDSPRISSSPPIISFTSSIF